MSKTLDANDLMRAGTLPADPSEGAQPIPPRGAIDVAPANDAKPRPDPLPLIFAPALAEPLEPIEWLCETLGIAMNRPNLLSGYGGVGKTFAAQEALLVVAAGLETMWGGHRVAMKGPVVHIDYEQTLRITKWRYQRLARGLKLDLASLGERLALVSLPEMWLTDPRAEAELIRVCSGRKVCLVDNLRAACPGVDENTSEVARYLYMLGRVGQATGCIFLVIVHEGKDDPTGRRSGVQRVRGSSAIVAAAGAVVSFVKDGDYIRIENTRNNLGAEAEHSYVRLVDEGDVDPLTKKSTAIRLEWAPREEVADNKRGGDAPVVKAAKAAILGTVRKLRKPTPKSHVLDMTTGKATAKREALATLLADGTLVETDGGKGKLLISFPSDLSRESEVRPLIRAADTPQT